MEEIKIISFIFLILGIFVWFFFGRILRYRDIKKNRKDAISRSKSAVLGEVYEKIIPHGKNFPYHPKDMVFIGKGIDYLVFDGLASGNLSSVVFLEVKSGKSGLNKNERMIQSVVNKKNIQYKKIQAEKFF